MISTLKSIPTSTRIWILLSLLIWLIVFTIWWVANGEKCSMQSHLLPMLLDLVRIMSTSSVTYWMDYGTLLGLVRDHRIIPWEFDLDIGLEHSRCDVTETLLKQQMKPLGYYIYGPKDYIPMKANWLLGNSPYIHTPCIRVYDHTKQYSIDIYWYDLIKPEQVDENGKNTVNDRVVGQLPADFKTRGLNMLCNDEGYTDEIRGGCRYESELLPITHMTYETMDIPLPANSTAVLERMYGQDWIKPRPKGYKILLCSWFPTHPMFTTTALMALILLSAFYVYRGRELWYRLRSTRTGGYQRVPMEHLY